MDAASETVAPDAAVEKSWLFTSPYYNPMTMCGSYLSLLNENLLYNGYHLDRIELKGDQLCMFGSRLHLR